jgi:RNA polymerase sigma-70 factor (ECF subfamily)
MIGEAALAAAGERSDIGPERLGLLFDVHYPRLYRLARRLASDADEARDLVQDVFLRAARDPSGIPDGASQEEAWLVRVLINLCRDRWRQTATRKRLDVVVRSVGPRPADPEAALIARSIVWRALQALPPRRRAVLVMHELEGVSIAAIARTLGVTQATVRWHLAMARRHMARTIGALGEPR